MKKFVVVGVVISMEEMNILASLIDTQFKESTEIQPW
jgi:hypothetical protein